MKKKNILLTITAIMALTGCNNNKKIKNPEGVDIAKILLANERLDENQLRNEGDLFTSGKEAFNQIQKATKKYALNPNHEVKSAFKKDGTRYTWSGLEDYSNFLSYFYSYSDSIEHSAKKGSSLIELTKESIKTTDTWIKFNGNTQILLTVDKNSETIISQDKEQYEICRRYQNDLGQNTFEMFISNNGTNAESRMTYIPGLRYEFTLLQEDDLLVIVANKDKGYWDIMSTSYNEMYNKDSMSFSNFVIKDEAIYETTYTIGNYDGSIDEYFGSIKLVSSDGKSDMISIDDNSVSIFTTGIKGLDCFYIDALDSEVGDANLYDQREQFKVLYNGEGDNRSYFTDSQSDVIAKFSNGKELKKGDSFNGGEVLGTCVNPIGDMDFYGEINLQFNESNINFILNNIESLMKEYEFTFKDDFNVIKEALTFAKKDSTDFSKYYLWQDNHINDFDSIDNAVQIEKHSINNFASLYKKYEDYPVTKMNGQWEIDDSYSFADLDIISNGSITNSETSLIIDNISVEIEQNSLLTNNTDYQICFAFAKENNNQYYDLYNLDFENPLTYEYNQNKLVDNSKFKLTQKATIELPLLEDGEYTLVAYIATASEGIRVSNPTSVHGEVNETTQNKEGFINILKNDTDNKINISSSKTSTINLSLDGDYTYEELYLLLESYAYKYGRVTGTDLEKENNNSWESIDNNSSILKGKYRLLYFNNSFEVEDYIIAIIK